jgi:hypothetical protein
MRVEKRAIVGNLVMLQISKTYIQDADNPFMCYFWTVSDEVRGISRTRMR